MTRIKWCLSIVLGLLVLGFLVLAPAAPAQAPPADKTGKPDDTAIPIPPEASSVTKHDWTAAGQTIHYTATAGNLLIKDDKDKPNCSIFYVAYTQDGADPKTRPVTFFYNGGPGSAPVWLHMGSLRPVPAVTHHPPRPPPPPLHPRSPPPSQVAPNQPSLIDKSDLVFIDAPMTGFSRLVGKGTAKDFTGVDQDVHAFEKFITRYITLNREGLHRRRPGRSRLREVHHSL